MTTTERLPRRPRRVAAALLALVVAAAATVGLASPAAAGTVEDEGRLYELHNQARSQAGLAPLAYDSAAVGLARGWAQVEARLDQAARQFQDGRMLGFARALKGGTVYAVDIEPNMVKHMAERAKAASIDNLQAVTGGIGSPNLPGAVDVAFLLNVYHHIGARPAYFKQLRASLKPGGRVAIVDFRPDAPAGAPKHMRISAEKITRSGIRPFPLTAALSAPVTTIKTAR